jgi:hypothetical protein
LIFFFRILAVVIAVVGSVASVAARPSVSLPYVQYTSAVGASNPTCTVASGLCFDLAGFACLISVSGNRAVVSSAYHARKAPLVDPGPCGVLNTSASTVQFGEKDIMTTSVVILQ